MYPLAQAYDSVALDVDLEIGGNDQMFNMMCGRDLMKAMGKKEKFVITNKLLADDQGKKMGKTEGNVVNLDETPENMYGQIMAWPDGTIYTGFELCTKIPAEKLKKIYEDTKDPSVNPRDLKMKLAFEITKINHGEKKAFDAQEYFIKTVQKKETPDELKVIKLSAFVKTSADKKVKSINIIDLLVEIKFASSKSEARRLVEQGGVKIDGEVVQDINQEIELEKEKLIQRGKRQFVKVVN